MAAYEPQFNFPKYDYQTAQAIQQLQAQVAKDTLSVIQYWESQVKKKDASDHILEALIAAGQIAVAIIAAKAQMDIADMRYKIAKRYANLAKDRWNVFNKNYRPLEAEIAAELMALEKPAPRYPLARDVYSNYARQAFGEAGDRYADYAKRYRLCISPSLMRDMGLSGALASDDGVNFGYRYEEWYAILQDDLQWKRREQFLHLGRDLLAKSAQYAQSADAALKDVGGMVEKGFSGLMYAIGYLNNRNNTRYESVFEPTEQTIQYSDYYDPTSVLAPYRNGGVV